MVTAYVREDYPIVNVYILDATDEPLLKTAKKTRSSPSDQWCRNVRTSLWSELNLFWKHPGWLRGGGVTLVCIAPARHGDRIRQIMESIPVNIGQKILPDTDGLLLGPAKCPVHQNHGPGDWRILPAKSKAVNPWKSQPPQDADLFELACSALERGLVKVSDLTSVYRKSWVAMLPRDMTLFYMHPENRRVARIRLGTLAAPASVGVWFVTSRVSGNLTVVGALVPDSEGNITFVPVTCPPEVWKEVETMYKEPRMLQDTVLAILRKASSEKGFTLPANAETLVRDEIGYDGWMTNVCKENLLSMIRKKSLDYRNSSTLPWDYYNRVTLGGQEPTVVEFIRIVMTAMSRLDVLDQNGKRVRTSAETSTEYADKEFKALGLVGGTLSQGSTAAVKDMETPSVPGYLFLSECTSIRARDLPFVVSDGKHCSICGRRMNDQEKLIGPDCKIGLESLLLDRNPVKRDGLFEGILQGMERTYRIYLNHDIARLLKDHVDKLTPKEEKEMIKQANELSINHGMVSQRLKMLSCKDGKRMEYYPGLDAEYSDSDEVGGKRKRDSDSDSDSD